MHNKWLKNLEIINQNGQDTMENQANTSENIVSKPDNW